MRIQLISVGNRMPDWVTAGWQEYVKRLPRECELSLREITPAVRTKSADLRRIIEDEGQRMSAAIAPGDHVVALDLSGKEWNTPELAQSLGRWMGLGCNVALLVGGPDGLAPACLSRANERWRLSALTFPHPLVRVILAEQIYRAWTILQSHPYHR